MTEQSTLGLLAGDLASLVGAENLDVSESGGHVLGPDTGMYGPRRVPVRVRPSRAGQVPEILRTIADSGTGLRVHPYSTGFNWGLGSKEPARDDVAALDLSGLDRVRDLNAERGWAVVEPGVTQGVLSTMLEGTDRMANVTVASAHTSFLGNALDRGVGLRSQRTEDVLGLEVVLPDGRTVRVGWWPGTSTASPYPHGLGPSTLGLFAQSDYGIVTAAAIRLLPRPEEVRLLAFHFEAESLGGVTELLHYWVSQGYTRSVPKLYDPPAAAPYGCPEGRYLLHVCVDGSLPLVEATVRTMVAQARESDLCTDVVDGREKEHDELSLLVERAYGGDPDVEDTIFRRKVRTTYDRMDAEVGFLLFLPLVPFTAEDVLRAERLLGEVREEFGLRCGSTLHPLDSEIIDYVVNVRFPRTEEGARTAHRALDALHKRFGDAGYMPYRLDVGHAGESARYAPSPEAADLARGLKDHLDPAGVIAPGRY
ncbi:FAD-binding oxidoreductase [Salininema proteolyticum]|uniref:FAD-binding oxidoreductase n=1 Tax=Salininema proteolyticum TaxID=1607685 RepID=A0ABV8TZR8_9ACTN